MTASATIRAVIFDLDGTLVNTEPMHFEGVRRVMAAEEIPVRRDDYYSRLIHFTDHECFALLLQENARPASPGRIEELVARKAALFIDLLDDAELSYPAAGQFVKQCARCFSLAIATGALRAEADLILKRLGLRELFGVIVAAEDVPRGKPQPDPYLVALDRLNAGQGSAPAISAMQCLVVEDTPGGIEAARRAGMRVLAVAQTFPAQALTAADLVRPSLAETNLQEIIARLAQ